MTEIDYAELFKSPLDDEPAARHKGWGPIAGGLILGILVVGALTLLDNSEDNEAAAMSTAPTSTTAAPTPTPVVQPYPAGFTEISPGLAAEPIEVIRHDDSLLVAFHTAAERDSDPSVVGWPIGGSFWLESADGTGTESSRLVLGRFSPGVFAVQFPRTADNSDSDASVVRMIERWDLETETGSRQLPFDGKPYVMPEPLTIPVTTEATLVIDELELGAFLGRVNWRLEGTTGPIGRFLVEVTLFDTAGAEVGTYSAFAVIRDPAAAGEVEVFWQGPFPPRQDDAVTAEVDYTVGLVDVVATDVEFDLQGVRTGQ